MALRDYTAGEIADALREAGGIITEAARKLDCSRTTIYKAIDEYKTVEEAREDARDELVDRAEKKLVEKVDRGEDWAIRMVLRTQRPDEWEREKKQETTIKGDSDNPVPFEWVDGSHAQDE